MITSSRHIATILLLLLSTLLFLCACTSFSEESGPDFGSDLPEFLADDCPFEVSDDDPVTCGYLAVPEDRTKTDGASIELAVAILDSIAPDPQPDPIIYLDGGPGGSALIGIDDWLESPLRQNRQIILFDQRGTGFSWPNLDCPETDAFDAGDLPEGVPKIEAVEECRDRLRSLGVDLSMYNSANSAADVRDLFTTLGAEYGINEWNLFGISYGTRLALTIMRDHPQQVRSVILDSVYPPVVDAYTVAPQTQADAILALFESCANDPTCNAAFPNLADKFFGLVDQLNDAPINNDDAYLSGDDMVHTLVGHLYDSTIIPHLPHAIAAAADNDFEPWFALGQDGGDEFSARHFQEAEDLEDAQGMFYSVECNEEIPFGSLDEAQQVMADYAPQLAEPLLDELAQLYDECAIWGAGEATSVEELAVKSEIRTLLLSGELDPVTPPSWAEIAAQTLPNSLVIEMPRGGHSVSSDGDCTTQIIADFLDNLTTDPNVDCAAEITPFALP